VGRIQEQGFEASVLDDPAENAGPTATEYEQWLGVPWQIDAEQSLAVLKHKAPDWLVVDHYGLNEPWERQVRSGCKALLVIDDLLERRHFCDLLVDQNLSARGVQHRDRVLNSEAEVLIGPRYAMLAPGFRHAREKGRGIPGDASVRRLVLYFGGSDPTNETVKALSALETFPRGCFDVDVVTGALNPNQAEVESRCRSLGYRQHASADMASLYAAADFALGASGTSSWERMCVGVPSIVVAVAENQEPIGEMLNEAGCAFYLGKSCNVTSDDYAGMLGALRYLSGELRRQSERGRELVDGRGAERVATRMIHWWLRVRAATLDDSQTILAWRNSEEVRRWSFDSAPISLQNHDRWIRKALENPERVLLMAEAAGNPVGVVRFDCKENEATISIFLDPGRMGRGLGAAVLRNAHGWLARERPEITRIFADIIHGNDASEILFREAGYREASARYVRQAHSRGNTNVCSD
jgi:UDP-2,4-diacetamido-2,4,6-trideoxy-beta-L-altropyranose hydrolase